MSVLSTPQQQPAGAEFTAKQPGRFGFFERFVRGRLIAELNGIAEGSLTLRDGARSWSFGSTSSELSAEVRVHDPRFYREIAAGGTLGASEAYLRGWWSSDDLLTLLRIFARNVHTMSAMDGGAAKLYRMFCSIGHLLRRNTIAGSRRNIAAHYDLGNDFYSLFLDETMTYSSGVFPHARATLAEASEEKYDRICRNLALTPADHVLEIGSGWGGFAIHAARNYGCRVTTTTISARQHEFARDRIEGAGLGQRVTLLQKDYRQLTGTFDKLVSIEMIEAVGAEYLDVFFARCSKLLRPDGMMLLQAITLPDCRHDAYVRSVDFIQRYIFPGASIPSMFGITNALRRATDFRLVRMEDFALHYAETLARWRQRFWSNIQEVRRLGFDDRFIRMWDHYLCYCEAGFRENQIGLAQILLTKPRCLRTPHDWLGESDANTPREVSQCVRS